jgi:hypothetical protein
VIILIIASGSAMTFSIMYFIKNMYINKVAHYSFENYMDINSKIEIVYSSDIEFKNQINPLEVFKINPEIKGHCKIN